MSRPSWSRHLAFSCDQRQAISHGYSLSVQLRRWRCFLFSSSGSKSPSTEKPLVRCLVAFKLTADLRPLSFPSIFLITTFMNFSLPPGELFDFPFLFPVMPAPRPSEIPPPSHSLHARGIGGLAASCGPAYLLLFVRAPQFCTLEVLLKLENSSGSQFAFSRVVVPRLRDLLWTSRFFCVYRR